MCYWGAAAAIIVVQKHKALTLKNLKTDITTASKPADWEEREYIDDPNQVKPEGVSTQRKDRANLGRQSSFEALQSATSSYPPEYCPDTNTSDRSLPAEFPDTWDVMTVQHLAACPLCYMVTGAQEEYWTGKQMRLENFQAAVSGEATVVGCKCMGKCSDGPNVMVRSEEVASPSTNSLCIEVGLEDIDSIVTNFFGGSHISGSDMVPALS
ncbi:hypothetical protein M8C21_028062 [Ambrosia artemisiifolia]|uniref:Uncharacterized protein n=1 Tax=Ambrosia artemisiifolia TaxID=4212 RepID=A0AAD5C8M6_AMBAR|nr:hypothetical protein M8C21_028062 [Ambrosia artemisiifolia]